MQRREFLIGSLASLAAANGATAQHAAPSQPVRITQYPLAFIDGEIMGRQISILLDTGSVRRFQMSDAMVSALGLPQGAPAAQTSRHDAGPRGAWTVTVPAVRIGDEAGPIEADVVPGDIARIAAQTGTPFDAILGWPWFAGRRVTLDFASATLQVGEAPMQDAPIALSLQNDRLPLLDVAIDGTPARALFDTGAPTCNIDTSFSARTGALERHRLAIGNRTFELDFRVKDLSRMRQGTGAVAVIGLNLMLGRTIAIDGPDRRIAIGPRRMGDTRPAAQLSE